MRILFVSFFGASIPAIIAHAIGALTRYNGALCTPFRLLYKLNADKNISDLLALQAIQPPLCHYAIIFLQHPTQHLAQFIF